MLRVLNLPPLALLQNLHTFLNFCYLLKSPKKYVKYQGVKEFHMLVHIGVIVKLWFSVLSNLKSHIIIHPRRTNDDAPSNLLTPKRHCNVTVCIFSCNWKLPFVNLDLGFGSSTSKFNWFSIQQCNFGVPEHLT